MSSWLSAYHTPTIEIIGSDVDYIFPRFEGELGRLIVFNGDEWEFVDPVDYEKQILSQAGYNWEKYYPKEENCPFYCTKCGIGTNETV